MSTTNSNERFSIDVVLNDQRFQSGISNIVRGLDRTTNSTRQAGQGADKMGISFGNAVKNMMGLQAVQGIMSGIQGAIGGAVKVGMDYTKQMSKVEAISGSSSLQMAQLGANARKLGADTKWSATNVAEAYEYMALAGWDSNAMIEASLPLLNLATTGALDLAKASDIVTDTMTPFGLAANQAGRVADVFATAQATANLNVEQLGETMKYAAPIAATFGASLEDTTVIAQIFANSGIKASMAGTALRAGLSRLAAPPKAAANALRDLNVVVKDQENNMLPLRDIIGQMAPAFNKLGSQAQVAAAKAIFGEEAYAGWIQVLKGGVPEFDRLHTLLDTSGGAADRMAKIMSNNLSGAMDNAKSAAENLGLILFSKLEKALVGTTNGSIGLMESLTKMLDPYGKSVEATKLLQTEQMKLAQTEALLNTQYKNGAISKADYNMAMDQAKRKFQENTSLGKNLADALNGVNLQFQSGKISAFQFQDQQNAVIKTMVGQVQATKDTYTSMNGLLEQYKQGKLSSFELTSQLSNQSFWLKQNAVDGGAMQQEVANMNLKFQEGTITQEGYAQGLQQISQRYSEGNLAGEVFAFRMASLDQQLANGTITQEQYNQAKQDAIAQLQLNGNQSGILQQMLADLDKQYQEGLITEEQYIQKKKEAYIEAQNLSMAIEEEKKAQERLNEVLEKFAPIIEEITGFAVWLWKDMVAFFKGQMEEFKAFMGDDMQYVYIIWKVIWETIKFVVSSIWNGIKLIISGAMDVISGIIKFIGGLMEGDWEKMWEGFKQILWGAVQIILGVFDLSFVKGLLKGIVSFGKSFLKSSGGIWGQFVKDPVGTLTRFGKWIYLWGKNFVDDALVFIKNLPTNLKNIAVDMWRKFDDINWKDLGKNVVIGIVNGIYSMANSIWKAASWMFSQLNPSNWFSGGGDGRSAADSGSGGTMLSSPGGVGGQLFSPFMEGGLAMATTGGVAKLNTSGAQQFAKAMGMLSSVQSAGSSRRVSPQPSNLAGAGMNTPSMDIKLEAPIIVDGRELARGTARYNSQEINEYQNFKYRGTGGVKQW